MLCIQKRAAETDENQQLMGNFTNDSSHRDASAPRSGETEWTRRNPADFNSVLLELARAQRGFLFYAETDDRRRDLADRAHRALVSDMGRGGEIALLLEAHHFDLENAGVRVEAKGPLEGLESAFRDHGIKRLRLDPTLTRTALDGFLDQLGHAPTRYSDVEQFAHVLLARDSQGLQINGLSNIGRPTRIRLSATPPRASASLAAPAAVETTSHSVTSSPASAPSEPKPLLEDAPLSAPANDDRGERLRARLIELQATNNDEEYRSRISDIVRWSEELLGAEAYDDYYRALLVMADHAVGMGGRSEGQARAAAAAFAGLANLDRLDDLIRRATMTGSVEATRISVRAAQLLLQLGQLAVPRLFDRLCSLEDPDRAAPLQALILTQGEAALPHLRAAIQGEDPRRAQQAIRLAGELQNPVVLPDLLEALKVPELTRRIETIRALSLLPGEASKKALTEALTSDLDEIAEAASEALGTAEGEGSVPDLLDVLEASLQTSRTKLGTTLVSVLGRIGDERAVPRLCSILERRPVLRRAHWHAIQLATVEALAILPTKEARRSLERAALHAPFPVCDRARDLLEKNVAHPPRTGPGSPSPN